MAHCNQTKGQTILAHGLSVARYYQDLYAWLHQPDDYTPVFDWILPEWAWDPRLREALLPLQDTLTYQLYHDCGKPFCLEFDDQGRRHFPNHAEISHAVWTALNPDDHIAWLIQHDMEIHLAKAQDAPRIASTPYWATQLLTGLAELHSNAAMFGGTDSTSFKIKYKALNKTGKRVLALIAPP